jgi:hypothetical protein
MKQHIVYVALYIAKSNCPLPDLLVLIAQVASGLEMGHILQLCTHCPLYYTQNVEKAGQGHTKKVNLVGFTVNEFMTISKKPVLVICLHLKLPVLIDARSTFLDRVELKNT